VEIGFHGSHTCSTQHAQMSSQLSWKLAFSVASGGAKSFHGQVIFQAKTSSKNNQESGNHSTNKV